MAEKYDVYDRYGNRVGSVRPRDNWEVTAILGVIGIALLVTVGLPFLLLKHLYFSIMPSSITGETVKDDVSPFVVKPTWDTGGNLGSILFIVGIVAVLWIMS